MKTINVNHNWTEKYRPRTINDIVAETHIKDLISRYIKSNQIPNLLLYGFNPGTGKTTLAKIIINSVECDELVINASEERTTDVITNKIKNFAVTLGFRELKIVLLDEFDGMTPSAQQMLRYIMEQFSDNCTFILTCNYLNSVILPIQSRCNTIEIYPPNKKMVKDRVSYILNTEKISFNDNDIDIIVDNAYPDIRKIISLAQMFSKTNILTIDQKALIEEDYRLKIIDVLKSTISAKDKFNKIDKILRECSEKEFSTLYKILYDRVDEYAQNHKASITNILADGDFKQSFVNNKEIQASAMLSKVLAKLSDI